MPIIVIRFIMLTMIVLLGLFIFIIQNDRNENISYEAKKMITFAPPDIPSEKNAYLALIGFNALNIEEMIFLGKMRVAAYNKLISNKLMTEKSSNDRVLENLIHSEFSGTIATMGEDDLNLKQFQWCQDANVFAYCSLLDAMNLTKKEEIIDEYLNENDVLITHYEYIVSLPYFINMALPNYNALLVRDLITVNYKFSQISNNQRQLAWFYLHRSDTFAKGLNILQKDQLFWRMILRSQVGLVDRMNAQKQILSGVRILNDALQFDHSRLYMDDIYLLLYPFSYEELDWSKSIKHLVEDLATNDDEKGSLEWLSKYFLSKPSRSLLKDISAFQQIIIISQSDQSEFDVRYEEYKHSEEDNNIKFYEYLARTFDTNAYIKLVYTKWKVIQENPTNVHFFIHQSNQVNDPYTKNSFAWDEKDCVLSFTPRAKHTELHRIKLPCY